MLGLASSWKDFPMSSTRKGNKAEHDSVTELRRQISLGRMRRQNIQGRVLEKRELGIQKLQKSAQRTLLVFILIIISWREIRGWRDQTKRKKDSWTWKTVW